MASLLARIGIESSATGEKVRHGFPPQAMTQLNLRCHVASNVANLSIGVIAVHVPLQASALPLTRICCHGSMCIILHLKCVCQSTLVIIQAYEYFGIVTDTRASK